MITREIRRTRRLDGFTVSAGDLKELCSRLASAAGDGLGAYTRIEFELPNETVKLSAESLDEEVKEIPASRVTKFRISGGKPGSFFMLNSGEGAFDGCPEIYASSDSEVWCAGVNEVASSHLRNHRSWYYWILRWFVWLPLVLGTSGGLNLAFTAISGSIWVGMAANCVAAFHVVLRESFFPGGVIVLDRKSSKALTIWTIVGAIAAVIAAAVAIVQLGQE